MITSKYFALGSFILCLSCSTQPKQNANQTVSNQRGLASLDDNTKTKLDPKLESYYLGSETIEERKFNEVAKLIGQFINTQRQRRESIAKSEKPEDKALIKDLPKTDESGKSIELPKESPYSTRDVHRKTQGCYSASLEVVNDIQDKLNAQISSFSQDRANEALYKGKAPNNLPEQIISKTDLGVFQPGAKYDAIVRYSNGHPGNRHDKLPDARGMALKILPMGTLDGKPIQQTEAKVFNQATELDILSINFPTFFVNDPAVYLKINEFFLKSAEDARGLISSKWNEGASIFFSGMTPVEQRLALLSNGSIIYSPLFQQYFSMVPSRLGPQGQTRAVKYSFIPAACSDDKNAKDKFRIDSIDQWPDWSKDRKWALGDALMGPIGAYNELPPFKKEGLYKHYYLRENTIDRLEKQDSCFDLVFQLYRDQLSTNIEDSTDVWLATEEERKQWSKMMEITTSNKSNRDSLKPADYLVNRDYLEKISKKRLTPYIKVASLKISQIEKDHLTADKLNTKTCEDLSFNPWNGRIDYHQPLGVVSRMKRRVYNMSRSTRHMNNQINTKDQERTSNE